MYIPDSGFMKRLKKFDDKLNVRWKDSAKRWMITRYCPRPGNCYEVELEIMQVTGVNGSYAPLDQRVFDTLKRYDNHTRGAEAVLDDMQNTQDKTIGEKLKDEDRDFNDMLRYELAPRAEKIADDLNASNMPKEDLNEEMYGNYSQEELDTAR